MTTILLVDSHDDARRTLATALGKLRSDWTIAQADSGLAAMSQMDDKSATGHVDVIITESQLVDMEGVTLLDQVRSSAQQPLRFTLSSNSEAEAVLANSRANQRFLLKPVSAEQLANIIERSMRLQHALNEERLNLYMSTVNAVPSVPAIYDEMMKELASAHSSLIKVASITESDTGLTVTVLKIVNSAFYGLSNRVESVGQAVTLLGVHLIKNITLTTKVFARFKGSKLSARRLTQLNDEAMRIGALANQFARLAKLSRSTTDHCQIAGMMANVGELIATSKAESDDGQPSLSIEIIGARLLDSWLMPYAVVEAVALQHESPPRNVDMLSPLVVLHSIRYLQKTFTDTTDDQQRTLCHEYLAQLVPPAVAEDWMDAFHAIEQLTAAKPPRAA
ncbi:MAG: HDOD domain-containing protein [Granulosicoccus sp.]|nr:HDOD domain-containing protein [Granulosicoccus sp.]